jgi:hypothetical protein
MIEYRITRELLQRRDREPRRLFADRVIKGIALFAGLTLLSLCLPQLLLPVFVVSLVLSLGL